MANGKWQMPNAERSTTFWAFDIWHSALTPGGLVVESPELPHQLFSALPHDLGQDDADFDQEVPASAAGSGNAAVPQAEPLTRLGARGDSQLHGAVERRHVHARAEDRVM